MVKKVDKEEILQILKDAVATENFSTLQHDSILNDHGVDSLDMATILLAIEENFGVKIPDEDVDKLISIDAILAYLKERNAECV